MSKQKYSFEITVDYMWLTIWHGNCRLKMMMNDDDDENLTYILCSCLDCAGLIIHLIVSCLFCTIDLIMVWGKTHMNFCLHYNCNKHIVEVSGNE